MKEFLLRANIAVFLFVGIGAHSTLQCTQYNKEDPNYLRKFIANKCLERYETSCDQFEEFRDSDERNSSNNGLYCCMACCGIPLCMILIFTSYVVLKSNFSSIV